MCGCLANELNGHLGTVIVVPMTTAGHAYPFRVSCRFQRKAGFVVLDHLRTVDINRLHRRLGALSWATVSKLWAVVREMFAE